MRNPKTSSSLLPALLCGAALFAFGCHRSEESRAGQVASPAPVQIAQTQAPTPSAGPQINELQPQAKEVQAPSPPPAPAAAREAELDARERRLQRQRQAALPAPAPAPAPLPAAEPVRPEPTQAEEPEAAAPAGADEPAPAAEPAREEPRTLPVTVPAGTRLEAVLTRTLASNTSSPGDSFRARISQDVIQEGRVAIPRGSEILGEVIEAVPLPKIGGQARLALKLTDLVLPSGRTVPVEASFVQEGRNETPRAAAKIGGAAAGGAILGRILSQGNRTRGGVIGAILGAAAGTAIASKTPGEEVVIPEGSAVDVRLDGPVQVRVRAQ